MSDKELIRLAVIDDHPLVHEGIAAIVELHDDFQLIGSAMDVREGLELLVAQPDVALVDLHLAGDSGITLVQEGQKMAADCRFIILTSAMDPVVVRQAMTLGVAGYLLKDALPAEMVQAIRVVAQGRPYMDPAVMEVMLGGHQPADHGPEPLTERQKEVLVALGRGLGTREIAEQLYVSESTVKKHISEILAKLGLSDRTQAALYAVAHGLVRVDELVFQFPSKA